MVETKTAHPQDIEKAKISVVGVIQTPGIRHDFKDIRIYLHWAQIHEEKEIMYHAMQG